MEQKNRYSVEQITALIEEQELTREQILTGMRQMMEIRALENHIGRLLGTGSLKGASHLYAGQEAVAVGAISAIREDDLITSTHRGHGHCHAHGDKAAHTPEEKQEHYNRMLAEVVGKSGGYCKGKGGSMHIADVLHGNLGATGIVSGNIPVATGAALAQKINKTDKVVLCFFGDGAVAHGNFHESLTCASMMDLPVVYIIENNQYAMSLPWKNASRLPNAADKACAYGIPGVVVDGMNFLEVYGAVKTAVGRARRGEGPTLIEAKTYRYTGHSHSDPRAYRTREEEAAWKERDAIELLKSQLLDLKWATGQELDEMETEVSNKLKGAQQFSDASPEPTLDQLYADVYAPEKWTERDYQRDVELRTKIKSDKNMRQLTYAQAIQEACREEMNQNPGVFLLGEDIGVYGGAYGATRGLQEEFGEQRVIDTPIAESAIGGMAVGAAMSGTRPVCEIMYVDFTPIAMDQIANQGAKNRYMFGGKTSVPMVCRTNGGAGRSFAAHHSQSLEALWTHFPGIYVVMPATPYDLKGLLKAAIRDDNPVMFIEHKMLYKESGPVPDEDYIIPFGVADIKREGKDVTIVTYSRMVFRSLEAAELLAREGIDVEVIDLRTLNPLDLDTIINSVKKTGRLVGVTEAYENTSFINEVMAQVNDHAFDWLDAPMIRVAAANVPVPRAEVLEDATIPNVNSIAEACRKAVS